ncbi:MAG TPA: AI-2E family transporter, partial [Gaiellaceae bacterium]|nr:AI-2E family transporter [Gaiellaceae bacterium]
MTPVRRVESAIPLSTLVLAAVVVAVAAAVVAVRDALIIVFIGIFLGLVFELPTRAVVRRTRLGRGLAATVVVIGSALAVTLLALLLLVPLVGAVRDFLKELPALVEDLRQRGALDWLGTGAEEEVQDGAERVAAGIPDAVGAILGVAGQAASAALIAFTVLFLTLFFVVDMPRLQRALTSVLMPDAADRSLAVWERITETVSRWAVGAAIVAVVAGTVQGTTAWLL